MARRRSAEAVRWQAEADRLLREREHRFASPAQLAPARR
jgi:hypothetical protein